MGIPAAFRWLSNKYPKIITPVAEDQPIIMDDGTTIPVDTTRPNPNGEEFDNLYLDMNGIVHPCSHPEDRPPPKDEEAMMLEVFRYTDRVVNMVRPRKLLMIAVDGVAPRAKMNQQRSRRFRSAREAKEKEEDKQELLKLLKQQNGGELPPNTLEDAATKAFDSNSITPGTPFMDILATSLRYWCSYKLNTDPAWAKMKVIISDATVPGEGEHKIMDFIRSQRKSPDHDPNTRHVIYGLDADLIMLGLATHEPHFRVLREDVFFQDGKSRMCKLCGQKGHDAASCGGNAQESADADVKERAPTLKPFIWLHVSVLREYLAVELDVPNLPFRFDLERAVDDWVFLCCFVGNDFLPHLPALEIRENGIDVLTALWRDNLPYMGGYVTKDGHVDLERAQVIMNGLGKQEDAIFKRRKESDDRRDANAKRRKLQEQGNGRFNRQGFHPGGSGPGTPGSIQELPKAVTHDMVVNRDSIQNTSLANKSAASVLKSRIQALASQTSPDEAKVNRDSAVSASDDGSPSASLLGKRKASQFEDESAETLTSNGANSENPPTPVEGGPVDTVRLWEDGYTDRYYEQKFHVDPKDIAFRRQVAHAYIEGLTWVLLYYFQGCPSWEWYYPYHYAPFAQDFVDIATMRISFEKGLISRPFEQLMSVLPAASRHALPEVFHDLMTEENSEIIDFYPENFEIDLNGKKMAWQGVALLPFIDMPRLLKAVRGRYPLLSHADAERNGVGRDVLLISEENSSMYDDITANLYSKKQGDPKLKLDSRASGGLAGTVEKMPDYIPHGTLTYPLERGEMPGVEYDRSLSIYYDFPISSHPHKSMLLRGVQEPKAVLDSVDAETLRSKTRRSGRSFGGVPLNNRPQSGNGGAGRGPINYGPGSQYQQRDRNNGGFRRERPGEWHGPSIQPPPPAWRPLPPGHAGFGSGPPPPPPQHGGSRNQWGPDQYYPPPPHANPGQRDQNSSGYPRQSHRDGYGGSYRDPRGRR